MKRIQLLFTLLTIALVFAAGQSNAQQANRIAREVGQRLEAGIQPEQLTGLLQVDSYTGPTTSDYLNQFRGNLGGVFNGDLAHLVGYHGSGGIAYVKVICNKSYGVGYSDINSSCLSACPLNYVLDAGISTIAEPTGAYCTNVAIPQVTLTNYGSAALTSVDIDYQVDGGSISTFAWTGNLASGESTSVSLPQITFAVGSHTFQAMTNNAKGGADENTSNDDASSNFNRSADQTWYRDQDNDGIGDQVPSVDVFISGTVASVTVELEDGDGNPGNVNQSVSMSTVLSCVPQQTLREGPLSEDIRIYPNPAENVLWIDAVQDVPGARVQVLDIYGRTLANYDFEGDNMLMIPVDQWSGTGNLILVQVLIPGRAPVVEKVIIGG